MILTMLETIDTSNLISLFKLGTQTSKKSARSSHRGCSVRKGVLRIFAKFTGKYMRQSLFFNKVAGLRPATLSKKKLWHRFFLVNFAKFLRTPFLRGDCFWSASLLCKRPKKSPNYHLNKYQSLKDP